MDIQMAKPNEVRSLTDISKRAFETDVEVGAPEVGGPPNYDSERWHARMAAGHRLFAIHDSGGIIGGAVLLLDDAGPKIMYIGRIFIDPNEFGKGFGLKSLILIEQLFPETTVGGWTRRSGTRGRNRSTKRPGSPKWEGTRNLFSSKRKDRQSLDLCIAKALQATRAGT